MVRIKQRYILCEILYTDGQSKTLNYKDIFHLIQSKIRQLHGDYGAIVATESLSPLMVKYLNNDTNIVLIRTKRDTAKMVQSTLTLIAKTRKASVIFKTLHLGGTIRSCKKFLINYHKNKLTAMLGNCSNEEERNAVKTAILDSCQKCKRSIDLMDRAVRERVDAKQQNDQ